MVAILFCLVTDNFAVSILKHLFLGWWEGIEHFLRLLVLSQDLLELGWHRRILWNAVIMCWFFEPFSIGLEAYSSHPTLPGQLLSVA